MVDCGWPLSTSLVKYRSFQCGNVACPLTAICKSHAKFFSVLFGANHHLTLWPWLNQSQSIIGFNPIRIVNWLVNDDNRASEFLLVCYWIEFFEMFFWFVSLCAGQNGLLLLFRAVEWMTLTVHINTIEFIVGIIAIIACVVNLCIIVLAAQLLILSLPLLCSQLRFFWDSLGML